LATDPRALLLDEPLSALDARARARASTELTTVLRHAGVPALLVTHDFMLAAVLGDEVAVMDGGRIVQRGDPAELAARPATAFVADLTGAVVLTGQAQPGSDGLTRVELDGDGAIVTTASGAGPVAVSVLPWEITLEAPDSPPGGSAQNRLPAEVVSVTTVGNRVRVGLTAGQPLTAEVTDAAVRRLGLRPGARVTASWKATATRLVAR
jgi:molybdate transport system ATP-binding protein